FPAGSGCNSSICGSGLLDAAAAVQAARPAAPTGLAARALGVSSMTWTWDDSGAASYSFHYSTGGPASSVAGTSLTQVGLATNTAYGAAVSAGTGSEGLRSATVTAYTLAAPPTSFALLQVNSSSITVYWAANTNWSTTTYRLDYWTAGGSTFSATTLATQATQSTAAATGLFSGSDYWLTVYALNGDGVATPSGVVQHALTAAAAATTIGPSGGTVSSGRSVLRIPGGAYAQDVQVSLEAAASLNCGASSVESLAGTGIGLEVSLSPAVEPSGSVLLTMSYQDASLAGFDPSAFAIARCDTATSAWVPLTSTVDTANKTVTAATGHLSTFQIMQASPPASVAQFKVGPNPVRPSRGQGHMNFVGPAGAQVRIYTMTGELVKVLDLAANGSGSWDVSNQAGGAVASGLYFVYVKSGDKSRTFKVIVER
ncbi:MAG: T9SS type A sorting domain-containing protein, partial [Elusimicrobia bacterium]|nr:T9SS type A sorting domain-containing protein [Elusimicrobiota bacterium]